VAVAEAAAVVPAHSLDRELKRLLRGHLGERRVALADPRALGDAEDLVHRVLSEGVAKDREEAPAPVGLSVVDGPALVAQLGHGRRRELRIRTALDREPSGRSLLLADRPASTIGGSTPIRPVSRWISSSSAGTAVACIVEEVSQPERVEREDPAPLLDVVLEVVAGESAFAALQGLERELARRPAELGRVAHADLPSEEGEDRSSDAPTSGLTTQGRRRANLSRQRRSGARRSDVLPDARATVSNLYAPFPGGPADP
jgi:hypothetical protein